MPKTTRQAMLPPAWTAPASEPDNAPRGQTRSLRLLVALRWRKFHRPMHLDPQGHMVCVVDANSLIFQVFHAIAGNDAAPRGEPVSAVFGFARDMLYLLEEKKPDYLFVAFDRGRSRRFATRCSRSTRPAERNADRPGAAVRADLGGCSTAMSVPVLDCPRLRSRRHAGHDCPSTSMSWTASASWSRPTRTAGN